MTILDLLYFRFLQRRIEKVSTACQEASFVAAFRRA